MNKREYKFLEAKLVLSFPFPSLEMKFAPIYGRTFPVTIAKTMEDISNEDGVEESSGGGADAEPIAKSSTGPTTTNGKSAATASPTEVTLTASSS